ncbi:hypothetical protein HDU97_002194 [Phlyctochytrium planicorne]|nr:hypothetical protein HDU97_002194 [Phlyctochytrium planicorne]
MESEGDEERPGDMEPKAPQDHPPMPQEPSSESIQHESLMPLQEHDQSMPAVDTPPHITLPILPSLDQTVIPTSTSTSVHEPSSSVNHFNIATVISSSTTTLSTLDCVTLDEVEEIINLPPEVQGVNVLEIENMIDSTYLEEDVYASKDALLQEAWVGEMAEFKPTRQESLVAFGEVGPIDADIASAAELESMHVASIEVDALHLYDEVSNETLPDESGKAIGADAGISTIDFVDFETGKEVDGSFAVEERTVIPIAIQDEPVVGETQRTEEVHGFLTETRHTFVQDSSVPSQEAKDGHHSLAEVEEVKESEFKAEVIASEIESLPVQVFTSQCESVVHEEELVLPAAQSSLNPALTLDDDSLQHPLDESFQYSPAAGSVPSFNFIKASQQQIQDAEEEPLVRQLLETHDVAQEEEPALSQLPEIPRQEPPLPQDPKTTQNEPSLPPTPQVEDLSQEEPSLIVPVDQVQEISIPERSTIAVSSEILERETQSPPIEPLVSSYLAQDLPFPRAQLQSREYDIQVDVASEDPNIKVANLVAESKVESESDEARESYLPLTSEDAIVEPEITVDNAVEYVEVPASSYIPETTTEVQNEEDVAEAVMEGEDGAPEGLVVELEASEEPIIDIDHPLLDELPASLPSYSTTEDIVSNVSVSTVESQLPQPSSNSELMVADLYLPSAPSSITSFPTSLKEGDYIDRPLPVPKEPIFAAPAPVPSPEVESTKAPIDISLPQPSPISPLIIPIPKAPVESADGAKAAYFEVKTKSSPQGKKAGSTKVPIPERSSSTQSPKSPTAPTAPFASMIPTLSPPIPPPKSSSITTISSRPMPAPIIATKTAASKVMSERSSSLTSPVVLGERDMSTGGISLSGPLSPAIDETGSVRSLFHNTLLTKGELPSLKVFEPLRPSEVASVAEMIAGWQIKKSGFLIKTGHHHSPSSAVSHKSSSGRSIASVLRGALHMKSDHSHSHSYPHHHPSVNMTRTESYGGASAEDVDAQVFYCEVREGYMFFYTLSQNSQPLSFSPVSAYATSPFPPLPPAKDYVRPDSPSRVAGGGRETSKAISKKTQDYVQNKRRTSVSDLRGKLPTVPMQGGSGSMRPSSPFQEKEPRISEEGRSPGSLPSTSELRRCQRSLFSYISLEDSLVDLRPHSNTHSLHLTIPADYSTQHHLHFDLVLDVSDSDDQSISSVQSFVKLDAATQRKDGEEWVASIKEGRKKRTESIQSMSNSDAASTMATVSMSWDGRMEVGKASSAQGSNYGLQTRSASGGLGLDVPITPPKSPTASKKPSFIDLPPSSTYTTSPSTSVTSSPMLNSKTPAESINSANTSYFGRQPIEPPGAATMLATVERSNSKPMSKIFGGWKSKEATPGVNSGRSQSGAGSSGSSLVISGPLSLSPMSYKPPGEGMGTEKAKSERSMLSSKGSADGIGKPVISGPMGFKKVEGSAEMMAATAAMAAGQSPMGDDKNAYFPAGEEKPSMWKSYFKSNADDVVGAKQGGSSGRKEEGAGGIGSSASMAVMSGVSALSNAFQSVAKDGLRREKREKDGKGKERVKESGLQPIQPVQQRGFGIVGVQSDAAAAQSLSMGYGSSSEGVGLKEETGSKTFFPSLFKGSLFGQKGADKDKDLSRNRNGTLNSKGSTLRRKVTSKDRPPSGGTNFSTLGAVSSEIPPLLRKCIRLIEEIGMETEGLYRISGSAITVDRLRKLFDADPSKVQFLPPASSALISSLASSQLQDHHPSLARSASRLSLNETVSSARSSLEQHGNYGAVSTKDSLESAKAKLLKSAVASSSKASAVKAPPVLLNSALYDNDIHVVTGVVKGFLREGLPPNKEPVCTRALYEEFIAAAQLDNWRDRMIALQDVVHALPSRHFEALKFLCEHLQRVSSYSSSNKMTQKNISIIFGPTLLKPPPAIDTIQRMMTDMPFQCKVVEVLLEQTEWIFGPIEYEDDEEVDEEESISQANSEVARDTNAGIGYFDLFEKDGNDSGSNVTPPDSESLSIRGNVGGDTMGFAGSLSTSLDLLDPKLQAKKDRRRGHFVGLDQPVNNSVTYPLWEQLRNLPVSDSEGPSEDASEHGANLLRRSRTMVSTTSSSAQSRPPSSLSGTSRSQRRLSTSAVSPADYKRISAGGSNKSLGRSGGAGFQRGYGAGGEEMSVDNVFESTKDAFRLSLNLDLSLSTFLDVDKVDEKVA